MPVMRLPGYTLLPFSTRSPKSIPQCPFPSKTKCRKMAARGQKEEVAKQSTDICASAQVYRLDMD